MRAYSTNGPTGKWLGGFDTGATVHWTGQYEDDNIEQTGSLKPQMKPERTGGSSTLRLFGGNLAGAEDQRLGYTRPNWVLYLNLPAPATAEVPRVLPRMGARA